MKLSEKGHYAPPPQLPSHAQRVSKALASWPEMQARTHWELGDETIVDGADFYVGEEEVGHIHLDAEAHVTLPAKVAKELIAKGIGRALPWSREVVVHDIRTARDEERALWLFRLSYDYARGATSTRSQPSMDGCPL